MEPVAFLLRSKAGGRNSRSLSVNIAARCSLDECRRILNPCHGIAALTVAEVRSLGLDIVSDSANLKHAFIIGLPYPDEDAQNARRLAGRLAARARLVWQRARG